MEEIKEAIGAILLADDSGRFYTARTKNPELAEEMRKTYLLETMDGRKCEQITILSKKDSSEDEEHSFIFFLPMGYKPFDSMTLGDLHFERNAPDPKEKYRLYLVDYKIQMRPGDGLGLINIDTLDSVITRAPDELAEIWRVKKHYH